MSSRRKWTIAALIVVAAIAATAVWMGMSFARLTRGLEALTIGEIDVSSMADGEYRGNCDLGVVAAWVRVKVADGRIVAVDILKHNNGRGSAAEAITGRVIQAQSVQVDAISGATASSRVILKAIENALSI